LYWRADSVRSAGTNQTGKGFEVKVKRKCAAALAVVAMLALAPSAGASAMLNTLTQTNGVLSATWTLDPGSESWEFQVSTSDLRDVDGYFVDEIRFADLARDQTSFTAPEPLPPGQYFVQIFNTPTFDICADPAGVGCTFDYSNIRSVFIPPPPPPPGPPPPLLAPLSSADFVVAEGDVTVASSQHVNKLSIKISPGENVRATLSGSVSVPGASKVFKFKSVTKSVAAAPGPGTKLALKLPAKAKKAVKKALKRKKVLKAKLKLLLTDAAGNKKTSKYTVRLKP
jgi:hypothetical protein